MENTSCSGLSPLYIACCYGRLDGRLDVARYLLEQGADRDKATPYGWTPLHTAALSGHLETAKLLMVYGANLNARTNNNNRGVYNNLLPIDMARTEEVKQAIRDEPRRRMEEAPGKRATEQDKHPNTASAHQVEEEGEDEPRRKKPRLDEGVTEEDKVAEEDEDSEPSDGEDD